MTDFATLLEFIWDDHTNQVTHLVPSIDGFPHEPVVTVCGVETIYASSSPFPEYKMCADCTDR